MAKKSELLKKKWSDLSQAEKDKFKDKSTFSTRRQSKLQIERTTGTRSQRTEGKGPKGAMLALGADGRLGDKDIKFLAENYPGFKASDAKTFLGRKKNQDIKGPKSTIKTTIRSSRGKDTGNGNGTRNGNGKDTGNGNGTRNGNGKDTDTDPFEDIEFPSGKSGKEFRKYKPQGKAIREAAEADLAAKMKESFKPEVLGKAKTLKEKFLGDKKEQDPKKLTGRAKRQYRIDKIGKVKKPKFETYESRVDKIRKGEGKAATYAYSTRFRKLGEKLGVGYTPEERRTRTKERLGKLKLGTQGAYETTAQSRKRRREAGEQAIASMRIS